MIQRIMDWSCVGAILGDSSLHPPLRAGGVPWVIAGWSETAGVSRIPGHGGRMQRSGVGLRPNPLPSRCVRPPVAGPTDDRLNGHCTSEQHLLGVVFFFLYDITAGIIVQSILGYAAQEATGYRAKM